MLGLVPSRSGALSACLSRVLALCQDLRVQDFVNGVLVFHADDIAEVLHAHEPLTSATLEFSGKFDTSMIKGAIQAWQERTYGIVVIDGSEASIGMARSALTDSFQNAAVTSLSHVTAKLASRTRRGGQSAPRFARARQGEELAFLRKVADMVVDELRAARGLILGGKADMKRKLLGELPEFLRTRVHRMVDIDTGSRLQGLLMTARDVADVAARRRRLEAAEAVAHFMGLVSSQSDLVCYGVQETTAALRLAAVETLLVSSCKTWDDLARSSGAHVLLVSPETELGRDFCAGFQVGALLRWKVEAQLMETEVHTDEKSVQSRLPLKCKMDGTDVAMRLR